MKQVVFITPPSLSHRTSEESLGIAYLAAVLRANNIPVTIIDNWLCSTSYKDTITQLQEIDVALIGISAYISSLNEVEELIRTIRTEYSETIPIMAGGFGPTFHPYEFIRVGANYIIRGEAESIIVKLYNNLTQGLSVITIPGLSYTDRHGQICETGNPTAIAELDTLPFPARDTIERTIALKNPIHINTSRGCLANCLFCSVIAFDRLPRSGARWRHRSIMNVVDEIELLYQTYGVSNFKFVDDSFIEPPRDEQWAEQFATELYRRKLFIQFRTQVRADRLTEPLVSALSSAGWYATSVGVENWSPTALRRMNKSATIEENLTAVTLLEKYQVYVQMGMILFDHTTTLMELQENLTALKQLNWAVTKGIFTEMFASEGTPFMKLLRKHNLEDGNLHGNVKYQLKDPKVLLVYKALKAWHKNHAELHDHAINPISAPKTLPVAGYHEYWQECMKLNKIDLSFFETILEAVMHDTLSPEVERLTHDFINHMKPAHNRSLTALRELDQKYGLVYDAHSNKFLE